MAGRNWNTVKNPLTDVLDVSVQLANNSLLKAELTYR